MIKVTFQLKAAGYCVAKQSHALKGGSHQDIKFYATYAIIKHPLHGYVLFDTGYTRRFYSVTKSYPFRLYAMATPVYIRAEEEAKQALINEGIQPEDVKYIIISHFHADHIGGLKDFPNATFICSESAYQDIEHRRGFSALRKGLIPSLLPNDFTSRLKQVSFKEKNLSNQHLGNIIDLFEDQSILLCKLDGHAKGQLGAILNCEHPTFLISDGAWLKENYQNLHLPSPLVRLFFDSWTDYKRSLENIHNYHKANPDTLIIPCHCEATLTQYQSA